MKKLLFVATASLCATVFGAIESSNVVGYQTKTLGLEFNYVAPTFIPVGGGNVDIQNIKLNNGTEYGDNIQVWDEGGALIANYYYVGTGWSEDFVTPVEGVTVPAGACVVIEAMSEEASITFSGAVNTNKTTVTSVAGFNMVGNVAPVDIDVQDIKLVNGTEWGDNIQIWDNGGQLTANYYYIPTAAGTGWSEDFVTLAEGVTIAAGQGFTIEIMDPTTTIELPGAAISQ